MTVGVGDVIEAVAAMSHLGQVVENVYHFVNASASTPDEDALIDIAAFLDDLYTLVTGVMSDNLLFDSIRLRNVSDDSIIGEIGWPVLVTGTSGATSSLMTQAAALVSFPTAFTGVRGRKFIPGLSEDELVGGLWNSTMTDALEDYSLALLGLIPGADTEYFYRILAPSTPGGLAIPTGALITNVPSTLSRRRIGAGA